MIQKKGIDSFRLSDVVPIFIATIAIGSFYPAMWDAFLIGRAEVIFQLLYLFIWFLFLVTRKSGKFEGIDRGFLITLFTTTIYYFIHCLIHDDKYEYLIVYVEIAVVIYLAKNTFPSKKFMTILTILNCIMVAFMVVGTVLFYLDLLQPIGREIIVENGVGRMTNYGLFFLKSHADWDDVFIRPSGYYDEPGSMAFVSLLLLVYNKLHLKNRWVEIILLFGNLFTLSSAHFITFVLYILFFYSPFKKGSKSGYVIIPFLVVLIWFYFYETNNIIIESVQDALFGRTKRIAEGTDASRNFDIAKKAFYHYFPYGASMTEIDRNFHGVTHETVWYYFARFGLFGSIILFIPVIQIVLRNFKKGLFSNEMLLVILLMINIMQRPNLYFPLYFLIIYFTWFDRTKIVCQQH